MSTPEKIVRVDRQLILRDATRELSMPSRRLFGKRAITLGGLLLLTGCRITDEPSVESFLMAVSRFNDRAQAWLFDPRRLAPTYPESMLTRPFPFNAYYGIDEVPEVDADGFQLEIGGPVSRKTPWTLDELYALPQTSQVTRHICVEGWSAIGKWGGTRFSDFLQRIGADVNRPGFRGGCLVKVKRPRRRFCRVGCSSLPQPRRAGYSRWMSAGAYG